jgi:integrase
MSAGIEITVGEHTAKIYEIANRGRPAFQVSFYKAGERQRLTFNKLAKAKAEARIELSKLVSVNPEVQQLATPDMEALVLARRHLVGTDVPVHVATETFAAAVKLLGNGTQAGSATIIEACRFYLKHGVQKVTKMPLSVCGEEFIKSRRESDSCKDYENQCRVALRALLASLPAGCTELADTKALKDWMVQRYPHAGTRNTNLRVLKTFARWLVVSKYAVANPFLDIPKWKSKAKPVVIYTPAELQELLKKVSKGIRTYIAIAAFAGLRRAEIYRLDWKEVNLVRGYITVAVDKAKTQARRLVPISENLRAWLDTIPVKEGLVVDYDAGYVSSTFRAAGIKDKRNALRHSYISYRVASVQDVNKVALEAGNSPEVIFRNYRELVSPEEAEVWNCIQI